MKSSNFCLEEGQVRCPLFQLDADVGKAVLSFLLLKVMSKRHFQDQGGKAVAITGKGRKKGA